MIGRLTSCTFGSLHYFGLPLHTISCSEGLYFLLMTSSLGLLLLLFLYSLPYLTPLKKRTSIDQSTMGIRIVSWNVDGIRTLISSKLNDFGADIICFQETKLSRYTLDSDITKIPGFYSFFNFSKVREVRNPYGYSGVATYVKESACPFKTEDQFFEPSENAEDLVDDDDGRIMITYHALMEGNLAVINVYCPFTSSNPTQTRNKLTYKLNFLETLQRKVKDLIQNNHSVIVIGDLNVKLSSLDSSFVSEEDDLTEEWDMDQSRVWFRKFLLEDVTDTFRFLHPKEQTFSWINRKVENSGTRIDYVLVDKKLENKIVSSEILSDVLGSDHCPVQSEIDLKIVKSSVIPPNCACFYPELKQFILEYRKNKPDDNIILILTDSKNASFDTTRFLGHLMCFVKVIFCLENISEHYKLIVEADIVILSLGLNDVIKLKRSPNFIVDTLINFVKEVYFTNPGIHFLFPSISYIAEKKNDSYQLNRNIYDTNSQLFNFSLRSPNFNLFDNILFEQSHLLYDGIHFTDVGKDIVSRCWVHSVLVFLKLKQGNLPLREVFQDRCTYHRAHYSARPGVLDGANANFF